MPSFFLLFPSVNSLGIITLYDPKNGLKFYHYLLYFYRQDFLSIG